MLIDRYLHFSIRQDIFFTPVSGIICCCPVAKSWLTLCDPWTSPSQGSLSLTGSRNLPKFMSIELVTLSNHLVLCCPLLILPSIFPSIRVFSNESALCLRWPKDWNISISPPKEYSGLISVKIHWFGLLAVQGTLKSLLQHHISKASILWCSAFFTVQLSHPYMTTGKTITLIRRIFVGKVMSLLWSMLSGFVIAFLPRAIQNHKWTQMRSPWPPQRAFHVCLCSLSLEQKLRCRRKVTSRRLHAGSWCSALAHTLRAKDWKAVHYTCMDLCSRLWQRTSVEEKRWRLPRQSSG